MIDSLEQARQAVARWDAPDTEPQRTQWWNTLTDEQRTAYQTVLTVFNNLYQLSQQPRVHATTELVDDKPAKRDPFDTSGAVPKGVDPDDPSTWRTGTDGKDTKKTASKILKADATLNDRIEVVISSTDKNVLAMLDHIGDFDAEYATIRELVLLSFFGEHTGLMMRDIDDPGIDAFEGFVRWAGNRYVFYTEDALKGQIRSHALQITKEKSTKTLVGEAYEDVIVYLTSARSFTPPKDWDADADAMVFGGVIASEREGIMKEDGGTFCIDFVNGGIVRPTTPQDMYSPETYTETPYSEFRRVEGKAMQGNTPADQFVSAWHPNNPETTRYLRAAFGQALHGNPANLVMMCIGRGDAGKSTFQMVMQAALGQTLVDSTAEAVYFKTPGGGELRDDAVLNLRHARVSIIPEVEDAKTPIRSGKLKSISAGDNIPCRALYKKYGSIKPLVMPVFAGQFPPRMDDTTTGMTRRVRVVGFDTPQYNDTTKRMSKNELTRYLKTIRAYLLWWGLMGYRDVFQNFSDTEDRMPDNEQIQRDTYKYFEGQDALWFWFKECFEKAPDGTPKKDCSITAADFVAEMERKHKYAEIKFLRIQMKFRDGASNSPALSKMMGTINNTFCIQGWVSKNPAPLGSVPTQDHPPSAPPTADSRAGTASDPLPQTAPVLPPMPTLPPTPLEAHITHAVEIDNTMPNADLLVVHYGFPRDPSAMRQRWQSLSQVERDGIHHHLATVGGA